MIEEAAVSQRQLVSDFEQGLAPGEFHHADHVRMAFAFVCEFPMPEALARFSAALKRFAAAKGNPQLYHETITWAYLLLIGERRMRAGKAQTWEEFAEKNPDLLLWEGGILERYYRKATLDSRLARLTFVFPEASR
jgi:hypothetical protein